MIFTIEEARDILRIDGGDHDAIIEPLIDAIPPYLETTTGYAKSTGDYSPVTRAAGRSNTTTRCCPSPPAREPDMNCIVQYNDLLHRGEIPAGRRIKSIYARLAAECLQPGGKYAFDEEKANRPIEFIERFCRHSKGEWAGQPVRLELFQKAFIQAMFGFVDRDTGLRCFREALFVVGRKNGKSTLLAGLALYMLIADGEGGAEVYSTATKYAQARLLFDECHNMVKQSPDLSRHMKKRKSDLYYVPGMSKLQLLSRN